MKKLMFLISVIAALFTISFAAFSDDVVIPTTGTILIQTGKTRWISDDGIIHDDYYADYADLTNLRLYNVFPAEPAFDEDGNLTGIVYECTAAQRNVPGFGNYFVASGNSVSVKDTAIGSDGHLSQDAVNWIKEHLKDGELLNQFGKNKGYYLSTSPGYSGPKISFNQDDGIISITDIPFGYYFIDDNTGVFVMIDSTTPVARIEQKNEAPELEKKITKITGTEEPEAKDHSADIQTGHSEDGNISPSGNSKDAHVATVQIGDIVDYEVRITAKKGAENYVFADYVNDHSTGLTFLKDSVSVLVENEEGDRIPLDPDNYEMVVSDSDAFMLTERTSSAYASGSRTIYTYTAYTMENGERKDLITYTTEHNDWKLPTQYRDETGHPHAIRGNIIIVFKQDYLNTIKDPTDIYYLSVQGQ